ncbi:hypothetical protein DNI29_18790 [Hymenobacter sediminis]|uniref:hypothetical protein n=1 Tax=Hymenobacter sediminis TaxID=2218621 RepID=UPI000DA676C7|nr:hypothetical protein [Hymenobacter sediminis]RPD45429.1 hypothetical protein DNI29_18790 [Hymenobacter sediminis]
MKYPILPLLLLLTLLPYRLRATAQAPDYLYFGGKVYLLYSNPLEGWLEKLPKRPALLKSASTACWRGYQATWLLESNQLFLLKIRPSCDDKQAAIPLERWFRPDARGRVAAAWVEGKLDVPVGMLLYYEHLGYESIYEQDWMLMFRHGRLVSQRTYYNRVHKQVNEVQFAEQLHQAVNWAHLPKQLPKQYRVLVRFRPDSTGLNCNVSLVKGCGAPYDAAALQAAQQVARRNWGATYRYGRWVPFSWVAPVIFKEENRQRFATH